MVVPAEPAAIATVSEGVMRVLREKHGTESGIETSVERAIQEALANAIRHGCGNDPTKQIQCVVTCEASGDVLVVIRGPGGGFDPASVPNPLAPENVLKGSGRGIFLIDQLMDEVRFADGGRELTMRKRGNRPGEPA